MAGSNGAYIVFTISWWRHQIESFSAFLALGAGNSPVPGEFPAQRPVTRSYGVFFDRRPNKRLSKHWWGWWFETPSSPLWRHCNVDYQLHPAIRFRTRIPYDWLPTHILWTRTWNGDVLSTAVISAFPNAVTVPITSMAGSIKLKFLMHAATGIYLDK